MNPNYNPVIVKVNNATNTVAEYNVDNPSEPTVIKASGNANYELVDQSTGLAPNHVITKRVGDNLYVTFEDNIQTSDLIIEDFYKYDASAIIGKAESNSYHYYVPDTASVASYVTEMQPGAIEGHALGGTPQPVAWWTEASTTATTDTSVLTAETAESFGSLPWVIAVAGIAGAFIVAESDSDSKVVDSTSLTTTNLSTTEVINLTAFSSDTIALPIDNIATDGDISGLNAINNATDIVTIADLLESINTDESINTLIETFSADSVQSVVSELIGMDANTNIESIAATMMDNFDGINANVWDALLNVLDAPYLG